MITLGFMMITLSGCASVNSVQTNTKAIDEAYQATWTAGEDKTTESGEEFSLTIGQDQLTFVSADPASEKTAYVTMDYTVIEYVDQVYHLSLSNPTGRIVGIPEDAATNIDANTLADSLWQSYQDMYINVADGSTLYIYPAGYEASPIALFQK